jgi:hypothetical protein
MMSWPGFPAIHVFLRGSKDKTWMPGTRPGMTNERFSRSGRDDLVAGVD